MAPLRGDTIRMSDSSLEKHKALVHDRGGVGEEGVFDTTTYKSKDKRKEGHAYPWGFRGACVVWKEG